MLNPYAILGAVVGAILLAIASFSAGVKVESDHRDSQQLTLERVTTAQYKADIGKQRGIVADMDKLLADQADERFNDAEQFRKDLKNAKKPLVKCPSALEKAPSGAVSVHGEPAHVVDPPDVRLTGEFIRLWNAALRIGSGGAVHPGEADGGTEGPGAAGADAGK